MNDINVARLKHDSEYWNEVAPTWATHYVMDTTSCWEKWEDGKVYDMRDGELRVYVDIEDVSVRDRIPRPKAGWNGEGFPPVGAKVEVWVSKVGYWAQVMVLAVDVDTVVWRNGSDRESYIGTHIGEVRPIRTPEQRQREELIKVISASDEMAFSLRPDDIADAILSRYTLEKKQ